MLAQQFAEPDQRSLLIRAEMVMNVPAQIIFAKIVVVFATALDDVIECVHAEVFRLPQQAAQALVVNASAQRPHGIHKGQPGQLRPGLAQVPDFVLARGELRIQRRLTDEQEVIGPWGPEIPSRANSPFSTCARDAASATFRSCNSPAEVASV